MSYVLNDMSQQEGTYISLDLSQLKLPQHYLEVDGPFPG